MKRITVVVLLFAFGLVLPSLTQAQKNDEERHAKEVYTGNIVSMTGRSTSTGFTLTLERWTTDVEAQEYLSVLASGGQDGLMKAIQKNNLGFIAATGQTRRDLLLVRETRVEGKRRIVVAFERWIGLYEARGGYRSLDHPFSIMEIFFDEKGKGSGTFIGLAQLKLEQDKKTEQWKLELENFGSFPAKVMGVMRRK
jgi:hypothetical protein